jgi:hypothetical protein
MLLSLLIAGVGCSMPAPFRETIKTPAEQIETPVEQIEGEGLRWEEDLAAHPPPPQNVKVVDEANGVLVTWEQPIAVEVPHSYSDTIVHYRVFRRLASSADPIEIGTTDQLSFVDSEPPAGLVFYHVTAVHEGDVESSRSDEADVVVGGN